jgi:hypothetical protein
VLPTLYTLFHVAKYVGPTRGRIFNGTNSNWLSGFHSNKSGVAYHNTLWITQNTNNVHGDNWVISSDQGSLYRSLGVNRTVATGGGSTTLSINGTNITNEPSDWAVSEVIVYDRELSTSEIEQVESYLYQKYTDYFNVPDSFNVPDLRKKFLLGSSSNNSMGVDNSIKGGNSKLTINQMASHKHGITFNGNVYVSGVNSGSSTGTSGGGNRLVSADNGNFPSETTTIDGLSSTQDDVLPPWVAVQYIIKY